MVSLGIILHDFEKKKNKNVSFAKKWETNQDFYRSLLNHRKNDGKATYIANLKFYVQKDPFLNHCAFLPHTKQLTFDYFFHLSVKGFKKCFENGLKEVNQLRGPFFI